MKRLTYEFVKQSFENEGYVLLSTEYINAHSYLEFICLNKHKHKIIWNAWQRGIRCGYCDNRYNITFDIIKSSFEQEGYQLLSTEYKGSHEHLEYICPNGHKHRIDWANWYTGKRCPGCLSKGWSKPEKEIFEYIEKIYKGKIITNCKSIIRNIKTNHWLELDIWLPEMKKAIEYNGEYWHKDEYIKWKDDYKQQYCKNNGIKLLVINHNDWKINKDFDKIQNFINI